MHKWLKHLKERGVAVTVKKIGKISLENLITRRKGLREQLQATVNRHNQSYAEISRLVLEMNGGIHPKHRIMNYHQFFLDHVSPQDLVLDLGCGNGYLAYDLAAKAKEVMGVDINLDNIIYAQKNYRRSNLQFLTGDATTYVYGKTVDKIILSNVLEHIENRQTFLNSLHRIAPVILLRVPLITRDWLAFYKKEQGFEYLLDKTHFIEYRPEELEEELTRANWEIDSCQINWGEWWGQIKSTI